MCQCVCVCVKNSKKKKKKNHKNTPIQIWHQYSGSHSSIGCLCFTNSYATMQKNPEMIWFDEMTAHTVPLQIHHHAEECETDADWKTVGDSSGSLAVPTTTVLLVRETNNLKRQCCQSCKLLKRARTELVVCLSCSPVWFWFIIYCLLYQLFRNVSNHSRKH